MKILHIVAGDLSGGAARGAYLLHLSLKKLGIDSKVFTNSWITLGDNSIITTSKSKKDKLFNLIIKVLDRLPAIFYLKRKKRLFSGGMVGIDFTKTVAYRNADIIHLHWINNGFVNIKHLAKIKKPIVWTFRDMWPMTGGCHYAMECERYKTGCGNCEQLNSNSNYDLSRFILNRKIKHLPKNITIVGISSWLSAEAKKSKLFKNFDIITISNNINMQDFFVLNKNTAKEILGIKTHKKVILLGANSVTDFYKGFDKYLAAIKTLSKNKYFLCFFGKLDNNLVNKLGFEYKSFGYINDNTSLRLLYSCADVFIAPSMMEAFGKTITEAMACKTPVVCFDATGPKDIVSHKIDGYKAIPFISQDLANGIKWILNNNNYDELCQNARKKVEEKFDSNIIAKQYIKLYQRIMVN